MNGGKQKKVIPGTTLFDGDMARKGYALNKMCFSYNAATQLEIDTENFPDWTGGRT